MSKLVKVLFFASLKDLVGRNEILLPLDKPCSFKEFSSLLREVLPESAWHSLFSEPGQLKSKILFFVNKSLVSHEELHSLSILPGFEVAFAPLASGG